MGLSYMKDVTSEAQACLFPSLMCNNTNCSLRRAGGVKYSCFLIYLFSKGRFIRAPLVRSRLLSVQHSEPAGSRLLDAAIIIHLFPPFSGFYVLK